MDNLKNLLGIKQILLSSNRFDSDLSFIKELQADNLQILSFQNNAIVGSIPEEIGSFSNLRVLYVFFFIH